MRAVMRMAMRRAMALRLHARSSSPSKYAAPPMRGSCPAMVLRMVDLPEPFGPMSVTILPRCTASEISPIRVLP